jgi:hypothetical protein
VAEVASWLKRSRRVTYIGDYRQHSCVLGGECFSCAVQGLGRDVRQHDGHPAVDEPGGQGTAQSLRRPSHDRDLTG